MAINGMAPGVSIRFDEDSAKGSGDGAPSSSEAVTTNSTALSGTDADTTS
jgi:hypothetical protein